MTYSIQVLTDAAHRIFSVGGFEYPDTQAGIEQCVDDSQTLREGRKDGYAVNNRGEIAQFELAAKSIWWSMLLNNGRPDMTSM